jgi:DNA-binding NarL/FixJ family response regulator
MEAIVKRVESKDALTAALEQLTPDVVLAPVSLAELSPLAALEVLQAERPTVPLIVVTSALDDAGALACLRAGAADLVLTSNLSRLGPAIEAALATRRPLGKLSSRQLGVLRLVAQGETTSEIARRLKVSVKTVEAHRAEVMKRLDVHNLAGLVRFAVRVGLI